MSRARSIRPIRARGFTLVELMVSLVAGILVSLAVVGLARSATNAFHEQARIAGTEASLRNASERLRGDLTRAGFLATPNIQLDARVAHQKANNLPYIPAGTQLGNLQAVRIGVGMSQASSQGPNNLATLNLLSPDDIVLAGDFTTDAGFFAQIRSDSGGSCGGPHLVLDPVLEDANLTALLGAPGTEDANVKAAFMPGNPPGTIQNYARIVDLNQKFQFAVVCGAGFTGGAAYVDLLPGALLDQGSSSDGAGSQIQNVTIAPVQRVRWYIGPNTDARLAPDPVLGEPAAQKFNLYRQTFDYAGNVVAALPAEIAAEYAIDLKFGITIQDPNTNLLTVVDMDDDTGPVKKGPVTLAPPVAGASGVGVTKDASTSVNTDPVGPQNVKSVRFRIALRTPIADRNANLAPPLGSSYRFRYCVDASCTRFARVRTIVSEVALMNQSQPIFCRGVGTPQSNCN